LLLQTPNDYKITVVQQYTLESLLRLQCNVFNIYIIDRYM